VSPGINCASFDTRSPARTTGRWVGRWVGVGCTSLGPSGSLSRFVSSWKPSSVLPARLGPAAGSFSTLALGHVHGDAENTRLEIDCRANDDEISRDSFTPAASTAESVEHRSGLVTAVSFSPVTLLASVLRRYCGAEKLSPRPAYVSAQAVRALALERQLSLSLIRFCYICL